MKRLFTIFTVFVLVLLAAYTYWFHSEAACDKRQGLWAVNGSYCIERSCYESGTCGKRSNPAHECSEVEVGATISEVYFKLGHPNKVLNDVYFWPAYKVDSGEVRGEIINGILQSLECSAI